MTVRERPREAYDPLGMRAGSFLIFPSMTVAGTFDDNVGADDDNTDSAFITNLQPEIAINSDWSRHEVGLNAGGDVAFYSSEEDLNYQDAFVAGNGQLDITRNSNLQLDGEFRLDHESREDPETRDSNENTKIYRTGGGAAYTQFFNRLNFRVAGQAQRNNYDDTGGISNSDHDFNEYNVFFRPGYLVSPRLNLFAEGRYNWVERDSNRDVNGQQRDSDGWESRFGAEIDVTGLVFGEVFGGYRRQTFDDGDFDNQDGFSYGIALDWNPTELTTVGFEGRRDFEVTTEDDSSVNFQTSMGVTVDHEFLRNLIVGANFGYVRDDFEDTNRTDDIFRAGTGLTYLLNRNWSIEGGYRFSRRNSDANDEDFTRNRVTIGLTARL